MYLKRLLLIIIPTCIFFMALMFYAPVKYLFVVASIYAIVVFYEAYLHINYVERKSNESHPITKLRTPL